MAEPAEPERLVRMRAALEKFLGLIDHKATYVYGYLHAAPKTFREPCRNWTLLQRKRRVCSSSRISRQISEYVVALLMPE